MHHIKKPWQWNACYQSFYFCDDPKCNVVYFSEDNKVIDKSELRTSVGVKDLSENASICYCFGVSLKDVQNHPEIKIFVIEKTKEKLCECEVQNPSGKCCLKDFLTRKKEFGIG